MADFKAKVYEIVRHIPSGRVMTYGQIAAMCGSPLAARVVGQVAHFGPINLPWHRVVNAKGGLASGFVPGGRRAQQALLEHEGVRVSNGRLDIDGYIWWPR